jgi:hypothetical protein
VGNKLRIAKKIIIVLVYFNKFGTILKELKESGLDWAINIAIAA